MSPRFAVVALDETRQKYTVRRYDSADAYQKDVHLMTSVFTDLHDAKREAKRVCKIAKVVYVPPNEDV
jgi:hypothetical protein